ncbi:MAG: hypothetical protein HYR73_06165 [Candidatus Eisenbacteria bacterium]|nr:hypothetical protein [Candidatus Eisenbacteria bacterium]
MVLRKLTLIALIAFTIPAVASAGTSETLFGPRIGLSSSPDQLVVGAQLEFPEFAPHLTVDPNLELGFLDNRTTISMNADFLYHFAISGSAWTPYTGLGLGINLTQFDHSFNRDSETDIGANLTLGASAPTRSGNRFFGELRVGLGDIPQLKLIAGWNFKM